MARQQFERVIAAAPREQLQEFDVSLTDNTAPGATAYADLYAPAGKISRLKALYLNANPPAGATIGEHRISIYLNKPAWSTIGILQASSGFADYVTFTRLHWYKATVAALPSDQGAQVAVLANTEFDSQIGLRYSYTNSTDTANSGERRMAGVVVEREVGF